MTPNEIFFGLITAAIIALVIFLIWMIVRLVDTIKVTKTFLETANQALQEAMGELNQNLRSLRTVTDNVSTVTDDLKSFSESIRDVGDGVRQFTGNVKRVGDVVGTLSTETMASVCGLKAGLKTGFEVFLKNLFHQGAAR